MLCHDKIFSPNKREKCHFPVLQSRSPTRDHGVFHEFRIPFLAIAGKNPRAVSANEARNQREKYAKIRASILYLQLFQ
jgi:hypothetical protein